MSQKQIEELIAVCGRPVAGHLLTQAMLTQATHEDRVVEIRLSHSPVGDAASFSFTRSWALTGAGEVQPAYVVFPRALPSSLRKGSRPAWPSIEAVFAAFGVSTRPAALHERFPELVRAIVRAPDDDGPRRVLADALLTVGDPRGELIAVQCDGLLPDVEARLLKDHAAAWRAELGLERYACTFRRGFIEQVTVDGDVEALARAWAHTPVRRLVLVADGALDAVLALPLEGLTSLSVEGCTVGREALRALGHHPVSATLKELAFIAGGFPLGPDALNSGRWRRLERLTLARCPLAVPALEGLRQRFGPALTYSAV